MGMRFSDSLANPITPQPTAPVPLATASESFGLSRDILGASPSAAQEGPSIFSVEAQTAEQLARAQEAQQLEQLELQERAQAQSFARQRQQEEQAKRKLTQQKVNLKRQFSRNAGQILNQWRQQGESLDLSRKKSQAEQLGFYLRLDNDKYLEKLQAEGMKSRLDDKIAFEEALAYSVFEDEMDLFRDSIAFRRMMKADQREFEIELAKMDLNAALEVAMAKAQNDAEIQKWSAIGSLAQPITSTLYQGSRRGWFDSDVDNVSQGSPFQTSTFDRREF